jgi:MFS transporter, DHA2 family, multidrug resistance protein
MSDSARRGDVVGSVSGRPAEPERAGARQWLGLALLVVPTLLLAADISVLYLALPHLGVDLAPTSTQTLWIIDIYAFLLSGFLITMGTLGDRVGRRRVLMAGAVTFGLAALLAAYATSPETLIAARALMGLAGAALLPSTVALITSMFRDPAQRTQAIGVWASSFSAGLALGPLVGGGLLEHFWWGSVFLVNVLVMALVLILGPVLLPEFRDRSAGRMDLTSATLALATVVLTIYGIKEAAKDGLDSTTVMAVAVGVVAGVAFARRQQRLTDPLVELSLFRSRMFAGSLAVLLLGMATIGGIYLFVTQHLQSVEGLSPIGAGLWLLPPATALVVSSMVAPAIARRLPPGSVVAGGLTVTAIGFLGLTQVPSSSGLGWLVGGFLLVYVGVAPLVVLGTDLVVAGAPPDKAGSAAGVAQTGTELGVALGIAILGSVGSAVYRGKMDDAAVPADTRGDAAAAARDSLAGAAAAAEELPAAAAARLVESAGDAFAHGLGTVAALGAVMAAGLAVASTVLLRHQRPANGWRDGGTGDVGPEPAHTGHEPTATTSGGRGIRMARPTQERSIHP